MRAKKKTWQFHRLAIVVGIGVFISYLVLTIIMQQFSIRETEQKLAAYQQELVEEQEKAEELDRKSRQKDDQTYLEQMAREKLGLYKNTEKIFIDGANR